MLQIKGAEGAVQATLGTVADLREAAQVLAVGSRAALSSTREVTVATLSGQDHTVDLADGSGLAGLMSLTMPPVSPRTAGGPLVDQFGRVVGIMLRLDPVSDFDQEFTFAVPADEIDRIANEIIEGRPVTHPWIGVTDGSDLPSAMARQLGLQGGVEVGSASPGSPSWLAGIRPSDIITSFDGRPMTSAGVLLAQLNALSTATNVPATFVHNGRSNQATVTVMEEPISS